MPPSGGASDTRGFPHVYLPPKGSIERNILPVWQRDLNGKIPGLEAAAQYP